jgi:hypothetical protein
MHFNFFAKNLIPPFFYSLRAVVFSTARKPNPAFCQGNLKKKKKKKAKKYK